MTGNPHLALFSRFPAFDTTVVTCFPAFETVPKFAAFDIMFSHSGSDYSSPAIETGVCYDYKLSRACQTFRAEHQKKMNNKRKAQWLRVNTLDSA